MTKKYFSKLSGVVLFLTFLLIVIGGATRVFDAGMACPDWPTCYGAFIPFPENTIVGGYIVDGTHYTWWQVALEWGHRLLAMVVGFGTLILMVTSLHFKRRDARLWKISLGACVLLLIQVKLGALTVWMDNIHWSVALHLGNAMLFFAAIETLRRISSLPDTLEIHVVSKWPQIAFWVFAACVWMTMILGAIVSSSHAGSVCGGLPNCTGEWFPKDNWLQLIHMKHRYIALVTLLMSLVLVLVSRLGEKSLHHSAWVLHILTIVQAGWGVSTLYSFFSFGDAYTFLSVIHLAWGTFVWAVSIGAILTMYYGAHGRFHVPSKR